MANLENWKKNLKNMIEDSWDDYGDSDHPNCPHCNNIMDFYGYDDSGDFSLGEGYWECSSCNFKITENEVKQNDEEFLEEECFEECPVCRNGYMIPTMNNWYECNECGVEAEENDYGLLMFDNGIDFK